MSVRELEAKITAAGIVMSRRQIIRHCKAGTFDATKLPAVNNVEEWFIAPASVDKGIADMKVLQEHRARRDLTRRDTTGNDADEKVSRSDSDTSGHDATRPDMTGKENEAPRNPTQQDTSRHDATPDDLDVYEHPYVKRLEAQVDKLENKLDEQVRRTEEIQSSSLKQMMELQRMITVGNSQTLADYMLKARDWVLGQGSETPKSEPASPTSNI